MVLSEEDGLKTCSICGGTEVGPHAEKAGISFAKCSGCGYVVADPLPSQAELDELYRARHGLALVECRFPYLGTPYEEEGRDGPRFCRDVDTAASGGTLTASPPFPGTMMSLVFRKAG